MSRVGVAELARNGREGLGGGVSPGGRTPNGAGGRRPALLEEPIAPSARCPFWPGPLAKFAFPAPLRRTCKCRFN